jgi:hypothetical protein
MKKDKDKNFIADQPDVIKSVFGKWIDYSDERPENGVCVIFLLKNLVMTTGYTKLDKATMVRTICIDNSNLIEEEIKITHWMRLPDLPKTVL